jgi:hypothetical protein
MLHTQGVGCVLEVLTYATYLMHLKHFLLVSAAFFSLVFE